MPDLHHHRPGPPPWWPEGEPWRGWRPSGPWGGVAFRLFRVFLAFFALLLVAGIGAGLLVAVSFRGRHWWPLPLMLLVVGSFLLVATGMFRRFWSPVRSLTAAAARLADGDYRARVHQAGPPPMQTAISSFNRMAERLETAEEKRRALLADVSHELRTPLTVIQGSLEAMLDGVHQLDRRHLAPILEETRLIERLLDDLRTLSMVEAGQLRLEKELCDPASLIEDAVAPFRRQAGEAGVGIELTLEAGPPAIEADPMRLRQVIVNLVSNALRYMPNGGTLSITAGQAGDLLKVTLTDTGPGIPAEHMGNIFDRFHKTSDSSGMGLGLAIVRGLVEAHGGEITASSEEGAGTTFEFSLPVASSPAPASD